MFIVTIHLTTDGGHSAPDFGTLAPSATLLVFPCPSLCVLLSYRSHYPLHRECDCSGRPLTHVLNSCFVSEKFCFFTAKRSERVQKMYFSLANIFMRLLLFCATPLNLPSWSLFFLVVVEVARPHTLVSWGLSLFFLILYAKVCGLRL